MMKKNLKILLLAGILATVAISDSTSFTIHVIGDSTVATYKSSVYPQTGWGQIIGTFFNSEKVQINNVAIGGRSSKTFYTDGRLNSLKSSVNQGDYIFIQFGHNDRYFGTNDRQVPLDSFAYFLKIYLDSAKSWNAIPVLVSPMVMNAWSNDSMRNIFTETGANYRGIMENLAKEEDIAFIDLNIKSYEGYKNLGQSYITSFIYHHYDPGDYPNWPDGQNDGTHFQENGSVSNSRWIAEEVKNLSSLTYLSNQAKQDIIPLINALNPLDSITIQANLNTQGLITHSAKFPKGAPLTLRVIPGSGEIFEYWADEQCNEISRSKIYHGIQAPGKATVYTAMFKEGIACVPGINTDPYSSQVVLSSSSENNSSSSLIITSPEIRSWLDMSLPDSGLGTTDVNHEGYTEKGFWNIENSLSSQAYYEIQSEVASTNAVLAIRYANGSTETRDMKIYLDGWTYTVSFPPTESWSIWDTVFVENVWIDAVQMPLVFESMNENGGPNIDALGFSVANISRASSLVPAISRHIGVLPKTSWLVKGASVEVFIFDILGTSVIQKKKQGPFLLDWQNLSHSLNPGVYFLRVLQNEHVFLEKSFLKR